MDCGDLELRECKQTYEANFLANISKGDEAAKQKVFVALTATREQLADENVDGYTGSCTNIVGDALGVEDYVLLLDDALMYNNSSSGADYFVNAMVDDDVKHLFYGNEFESDLEPKRDGGVYPSYKFTYVTKDGEMRPVTMYTNDGVPCDFHLCAETDQTK